MRSTCSMRAAIVLSGSAGTWISCQSIVSNLLAAYRSAFANELDIFYLRPKISDLEVLRLAKEIAKTRPERVIFLDYRPHPKRLLVALNMAWDAKTAPPIYIHLYGEFASRAPEWWHLNSELQGRRIGLICASQRHADLVGRCVSGQGEKSIITCPFPIDDAKFKYFPKLRAEFRKKLGASANEKIFLYSGRITPAKGVALSARAFLSATKGKEAKSRLLIAGPCEDRNYLEKILKSVPRESRRIEYLGLMSPAELPAVYNASDVGLSMSLYHWEDFGMAPAEALCTGARMIVSSWGGYASFKDAFGYCSTIPVTLTKRSPISQSALCRRIQTELDQPFDPASRRAISRLFRERFSIATVAKALRTIHKGEPLPFAGFNPRMYQLAIRMLALRHGFSAFPEGRKASTFYAKVFGAYYDAERSS